MLEKEGVNSMKLRIFNKCIKCKNGLTGIINYRYLKKIIIDL